MYRTTAATSAHFEMFPQAPVRRARLNKRIMANFTLSMSPRCCRGLPSTPTMSPNFPTRSTRR